MKAQAVLGIEPGSARAWLLACRPATLAVGVAPVLVGTAVAFRHGAMRIDAAIAALAGALLIQIGTNFANDVFDYEKGADTERRVGPVRATQAGLLRPSQVRAGLFVAMSLAALVGVYLVRLGGWPVVAIGVTSVASGVAYTGGPYPLGYHGLGDVFVFVFFGLVAVTGTAFVQMGTVPPLAWPAAIGVGAIATAVLVVNNVRDRATDEVAGKRTLVVRLGRRAGTIEYAALLAIAYAVAALSAVVFASRWLAAPLVTLPLAIPCVRALAHKDGAALNRYLGRTAQLLLLYSLAFAVGIALSRDG